MGDIALCADAACLAHPEIMGSDDLTLEGLDWLRLFAHGSDIRAAIASGADIDEAWIVSTEDVTSINLAAALRKDGFTGTIAMVMAEASGSALSRASAAGVDETLAPERFIRRLATETARRRHATRSAAPCAPARSPMRMHEHAPSDVEGTGAHASDLALRKPSATLSGNPRRAAERPHGAESTPQACGPGQVIAIMSGSGGVGKSTIAVALASHIVHGDRTVLILDGDLQFGCIHRMLGVDDPTTFDELADRTDAIASLAASAVKGTPSLVAAPAHLEQAEALAGSVAALAAAATEAFDVVIVDTGTSWSDMHAALMELATCTLFVMDQRIESIRTCHHALKLCQRIGQAQSGFSFILNRCSKDALYSSEEVSCAMDGTRIHEIREGGLEIEELCGGGAAASLATSGSPFAKSIETFMLHAMPSLVEGTFAKRTEKAPSAPLFRFLGKRGSRRRRRSRKADEIIIRTGLPSPALAGAQCAWEGIR